MNEEKISSQNGTDSPKGRAKRVKRGGRSGAPDAATIRIAQEAQQRMGQVENDIKKLRDIVHASLVKSGKRGEAIEDIQRTLSWLKQELEHGSQGDKGTVTREELFGKDLPPIMAPNTGKTPAAQSNNSRPPYMKFIEGKGRQGYRDSSRKPILEALPKDYLSVVLVMRWIEFLMERVVRDKISLVLDYYKDIGWISEDVKSTVMSYARGENQDVTRMDMNVGDFEEENPIPFPSQITEFRRVDDWRLTAEDHLKSLLFVQMIAGIPVDKDRLSSLEQVITKIKRSLEGFHNV